MEGQAENGAAAQAAGAPRLRRPEKRCCRGTGKHPVRPSPQLPSCLLALRCCLRIFALHIPCAEEETKTGLARTGCSSARFLR